MNQSLLALRALNEATAAPLGLPTLVDLLWRRQEWHLSFLCFLLARQYSASPSPPCSLGCSNLFPSSPLSRCCDPTQNALPPALILNPILLCFGQGWLPSLSLPCGLTPFLLIHRYRDRPWSPTASCCSLRVAQAHIWSHREPRSGLPFRPSCRSSTMPWGTACPAVIP